MSIPAIAPSPIARLLLELEARKATGGLPVGGRRIVLTDGAIVEVRPHAEDTSLGDFLVATGRLTEEQLEMAKREASAKRQPLEASLRAHDLLQMDVLLDTRRALWLDRFVRGLADEEDAGREPGLLSAEPHPSPGPAIGTLAFVLDALTRRAGFARDAERVGRLSQAWFEWLDTPQRARAAHWADLGDVPSATLAGTLFPRHPAAPSRIAALVRAGLARLSERRSNLPPPAPRNPGFAAPAPEQRSEGPITATRALALQLSPGGGAQEEQRPIGIVPVPSWLPSPKGALNDPLDVVERRITQLEQAGASASERGRAWLELAHAFRVQFDALDEAARAAREAVAADPNSPDALESAASWCSAIGRPDLAHAYAAAHAACLTDPPSASQALLRAAGYAARAGKPGTALRGLRQAAELRPEDPSLAERYARALHARGEPEPAVKVALAAAERHRTRKPEAARALLSWAHEIAPHDATVAGDYASILATEGYAEAAIAHIARAARNADDVETARRLWLHASVRAEVAARPDLAADLLLEAAHQTPGERAYLAPLFEALNAAGAATELSVVASEFASRFSGDERASVLLRAAEARLELPGDPSLALELCTEALIAAPDHERALALLEQLAGSVSTPFALSDALERILREAHDQRRTRAVLERFMRLVDDEPAPQLSAWARAAWTSLTGETASQESQGAQAEALRAFDQKTQALEAALWETRAHERSAAAVLLAQHLRRDPAQRAKARKLYDKVLEREPDNTAAEHNLASLLRLEGQSDALSRLLEARAQRPASGLQRVTQALALIYHLRAQGEPEAAKQAALGLLESAPKQREALCLLQRIALELGDASLQREALTRSIDAAGEPRARARLLVQLANLLLRADEPSEATRCAELALGADPRSGEAALLLVEHNTLLDAPRRAAALRSARAVLGDTPRLLRLLAQACYGINDARGQLDALETLLRLAPLDPFPALGLAALRATGKDAPALREAIATLIAPDRICDKTAETARAALSRLWMLGQKQEAAQLSLAVADALGEAGGDIVAWALPAVREIDDPHLGRAVLERRVARARGDERRAELRRLAHICRTQGARAAEARVYLRLLAIEPSDAEALERLATLYAETRELERLTAVLTLRLNMARTLEERRDRLLSLALASLELLSEPAAAVDLVRAAVAPEKQGDKIIDVPLPELRRGVGLLLSGPSPRQAFDLLLELSEDASEIRARELIEEAIYIAEHTLKDNELALRAATLGLESHPFHSPFLLHFERLALVLADVATGREVYRHLAESSVGQHGRRAILYRAARFLERAGALQDALEMAEQAFLLAPSEGAVFGALTRYAHATGQYEGLVHALIALAAEPVGTERRASLLARAAELGETQLKDVRQAIRLYTRAFEAHSSHEHLRNVLRCVAQLAEQDLEGARKESAGLRDALTLRAREGRTAAERADALITLAELALDLFQNQDEGQSYAHAAKHIVDTSEADDPELTPLMPRLEQALARARKDTRPQGLRTLSERPADKISIPKWSDPRRSLARPSARETLRPFAVAAPVVGENPRGTLPGVAPTAAPEVSPTRRSLRVEASLDALTSEEENLLSALSAGQSEALTRLIENVNPTIEHNAHLCDALLTRTRKQALNMVAVRGLWHLSERAHRRDLRAVTSELLSHVDPTVTSSRTGRLPDPQDEATRTALADARDDGSLSPVFTVLGHLFLSGGPLFRRPLANYGVSASDFIAARDDNAFADALRDVSSVLGIEHEAYLTPSGRDAIHVAPTYPPSLIIGDGTAQAPIALRFRIGAAFEQARPSSVLLAALARDAMNTLLSALQAAFGAANAAAPIQRDAAAMASELWRTLPSGTQKQIGNVLRNLPPEAMPYQGLIEQLRLRAARVGLVTSGALDVTLEHLALEGDAEAGRVPSSEAGLNAALGNQPLLANLLNFALSDAYLALRSRESS